jgi:hypothetical protein
MSSRLPKLALVLLFVCVFALPDFPARAQSEEFCSVDVSGHAPESHIAGRSLPVIGPCDALGPLEPGGRSLNSTTGDCGGAPGGC